MQQDRRSTFKKNANLQSLAKSKEVACWFASPMFTNKVRSQINSLHHQRHTPQSMQPVRL